MYSYAAVEIQRVFRGYCGRGVAKYQQKWKLDSRQMAWVHLLCIQVQRCFRGYYSRKYKQCMSRRRKYCQMLSEKSELMRQQMSDYAAEQMRVRFFFSLSPLCLYSLVNENFLSSCFLSYLLYVITNFECFTVGF